jgi:AraC-like DNA-binding protein
LRDFGSYSIQSDSVPNWSYNLVLRGSPLLRLPDGPVRFASGQAVLAAPRPPREFGWRDEPHRYTELLVWQWRQPPVIESLRSLGDWYQIFKMSAEAQKRLRSLHLRCRHEVESPDELTPRVLESLRLELDAEFARSLLGAGMRDDQQRMVERAVRWMQGHLHLRDPISRLCHYLQMSRSALDRVFDAVLHTSPAAHCLELRMQAAQKRLAEGKVPIKQIAYELGYKHPGNFSRAFRAWKQRSH